MLIYHELHKDKKNETAKKWMRENPERKQENQRNWQQSNPDKCREYNQERQHKNHKITRKEWQLCKEYFNNKCAYCGLSLKEHKVFFKGKIILSDFHKEHVDDNGSNGIENCVPSCKKCNSQKWKYTLEDWYNESNPIYSKKRYDKILKWTNEDHKLITITQ